MIYSHKSSFVLMLCIVLVLACSGYTHAQQENAADKAEIEALREKAFKLLDSVAGQLNTLQSAENRARMGANIADSLWKHDEERARSLLRVVQEDIKSELQKHDPRPLRDQTLQVFLKLRHDTVERIAKYDGEAALEFLKVTEPMFQRDPPHRFVETERALELRLARKVAATNPDVALKLGRKSLERGFSTDLLLLLGKLNRKQRDKGQVLYKEIVAKLQDADLFNNWESVRFVQGLVQSFRPPDADELSYRQLLGTLITEALEKGCGNKLSEQDERAHRCAWFAAIIRPVEHYDSRAAGLKHWTVREYYQQPMVLVHDELEEVLRDGDIAELEAIVAKHPTLQQTVYVRAIQKAMFSGDYDQARKMIDRYITDPEMRQRLIEQSDRSKNRVVMSEEKLAELQRKAQEIPDVARRASSLIFLANQIGENNRDAALKLLNQAGEIIEMLKPGAEQTLLRAYLATMYCYEKSDRGFAIMESLLPKLNELVEVAAKLDGYDTNYLRDGEWNMSSSGSVGEILNRLSQQAGYFAWSDLDRAVSLASQFERPEIRLMAHLKLAQAILSAPPKRQMASGY